MKRIVFALILCDATMRAENAAGNPATLVIVHLDDQARVPPEKMWGAAREASKVFAAVGIRMQWTARKPLAAYSIQQPGCATPERLITVVVNPQALAGSPDALALANLRTGAIKVFYDRIRDAVAGSPRLETALLAQVLVHEVAHVLQMRPHHADFGIMKAGLTPRDIQEMERRPLHFTALDIELIRTGLTSGSCPQARDGAGQTLVAEQPVL